MKQIADKLKPHISKALSSILALSVTLIQGSAIADIDTDLVRQAAYASGLESLATVPTPAVENLSEFLKPGRSSRKAAIRLGKALFWDMQVGSDGQACGSCHFHAGADNRTRNQLSPGLKNVEESLRGTFDPTASGSGGGPDYTLVEGDFPFRQLRIRNENATAGKKRASRVVFDSNDVVSSMGVFAARFVGVNEYSPNDLGDPFADEIFNTLNPSVTEGYLGTNVRRVEPRNTPTMINAVFFHSNFWDGRAHNEFNGVSVIGPLDQQAMIWQRTRGGRLTQVPVRIPNSSLASQAVGPPTSDLEMSFFDRPFPEIARKLMGLRPLGLQLVDPKDSVLGKFSRAHRSKPGIYLSYEKMIKQAFRPRYWSSKRVTPEGYTLMEANFSLFFGLAVQMYESTLVSDQTPFDLFMEGWDTLDEEQLLGLLAFINRGASPDGSSRNSDEVNTAIAYYEDTLGFEIGAGNCISCHGSTLFSDATLPAMEEDNGELELAEVEEAPELKRYKRVMELVVGDEEALLDNGFSNIGVRRTNEDPGRGGEEGGFPLAFVRQAFHDEAENILPADFELECLDTIDGCPERDQVDGAFKVPGLRNAELTGPYFHNGGQATLQQVIEFYDRQGDFTGTAADSANIDNVDRNMAFVDFDEADEEPLVEFLQALTDYRVQYEMAPFDHPQIMVPNGGTADFPELLTIPAVGANGRKKPLATFLNLEPFEDDD